MKFESQREIVSGWRDSEDNVEPALCLGLAIAWSAGQPHRIGEVALFPKVGEQRMIGRDAGAPDHQWFVRQRPAKQPASEPLLGGSISRRQLVVHSNGAELVIEQIGQCLTLVNGVPCRNAKVKPGDTIAFAGELVLICVMRPSFFRGRYPADKLPEFGRADRWGIVGESAAAWRMRDEIRAAALVDDACMVQGETGTGKELVVEAIHRESARAARRLTWISTTGVPEHVTLQLAGRDAIPGAGCSEFKGTIGAVEGGTLQLEGMRLADPSVLRYLRGLIETGKYKRNGSRKSRRADVRFIATTIQDKTEISPAFLESFTRRIHLPPLRERREDIPLLLRHLALKLAEKVRHMESVVYEGPMGAPEVRIHWRLVDELLREPLVYNVRHLERHLVAAIAQKGNDGKMRLAKDPDGHLSGGLMGTAFSGSAGAGTGESKLAQPRVDAG